MTITTTKRCQARQHSDQMMCGPCNLAWDVNDPEPPPCGQKGEQRAEVANATPNRRRAGDIYVRGLGNVAAIREADRAASAAAALALLSLLTRMKK